VRKLQRVDALADTKGEKPGRRLAIRFDQPVPEIVRFLGQSQLPMALRLIMCPRRNAIGEAGSIAAE
jgi:hypothetical protein